MRFRPSDAFILYFGLILSLISTTSSASNTTIHGLIIVNPPFIVSEYETNTIGGSTYDLFQTACLQLNVTYTYDVISISSSNVTSGLLNSLNQGLYSFILGFPTNLFAKNQNNQPAGLALAHDSLMVFMPNTLRLLVKSVLAEVFFALFIVMGPWFIIGTTLNYVMQYRTLFKLSFTTGFIKSLKQVLAGSMKPSQAIKTFLGAFWIITIIISMLLLGDFIYVISRLTVKLEGNSRNPLFETRGGVCVVKDDYIANQFLGKNQGISLFTTPVIDNCFQDLSADKISFFLASYSKVQQYFRDHPRQKNRLNFAHKQEVSVDYSFYISKNVENRDEILTTIKNLKLYYDNPKSLGGLGSDDNDELSYDTTINSSVFSNSILLTLISLTILSIFLILFLSALICPYRRRFKRRVIKPPAKKSLPLRSRMKKNLPKIKINSEEVTPEKRSSSTKSEEFNFGSPVLGHQSSSDELSAQNLVVRRRLTDKSVAVSESSPVMMGCKTPEKGDKDWLQVDPLSLENSLHHVHLDIEDQHSPLEVNPGSRYLLNVGKSEDPNESR